MPRPGKSKSFIFCVHAHQPVGNFDGVFTEAYEKCYRLFFEVLEKHPAISVNCHFSGILIDWFEKNKPEFLRKLDAMSRRGQIEFLGGGYYEPIYGAIPERDLIGQIDAMKSKLSALYGRVPEGAWLTERVWDPQLVKTLNKAGVAYTVVDDFHLQKAGVRPPVTGYFRARQGARTLDVFASMKELRYLMPFRKPEETLTFLRALRARPDEVVVFADDLEKFGMWPGTHAWVYKEGWLDRLFTLLEKDATLALYTFGQFRAEHKPKKKVRIPHGSYSEMMEWSGGRFYNFFDKYTESRYMQDRMWGVSEKAARDGHNPGVRQALYKAQCNCAYWHGVFGGLYLHHLRSAIFENLIKAEALIRIPGDGDHAFGVNGRPKIQVEKLKSGARWRIAQTKIVSYFNPAYGAALEELDFLPANVNLMCNLQRQREPYHQALDARPGKSGGVSAIHQILGFKEKGLEKHLHYDSARRLSFIDHFFEEELSLEDFRRSCGREVADFIGSRFRVAPSRDGQSLRFERKGRVLQQGKKRRILLIKTMMPDGDAGLKAQYALRNMDRRPMLFHFAVEFNFSIGEDTASKGICERQVRERVFHDAWRGLKIRLAIDAEAQLLSAGVETVSGSEGGLERTYQGLAVLLQRPLALAPGETKRLTFGLEIG